MKGLHRLYVVTGPDGRQYVGMTNQPIETRWTGQCSAARGIDGAIAGAGRLLCAIREFGPNAFSIEQVASAATRSAARDCERQLILQYRTMRPRGMNASLGKLAGARPGHARDIIDLRRVKTPWPPAAAEAARQRSRAVA